MKQIGFETSFQITGLWNIKFIPGPLAQVGEQPADNASCAWCTGGDAMGDGAF